MPTPEVRFNLRQQVKARDKIQTVNGFRNTPEGVLEFFLSDSGWVPDAEITAMGPAEAPARIKIPFNNPFKDLLKR